MGLGPIPTLPIFFKLRGRSVVLAGGSLPAVWKAELLVATGALVTVFAEAPCPEMLALQQRLGEALAIIYRRWVATDLADAALAIGALEGGEARAFRVAAKAAGVPVNVVDVPELCDFQFGTLIERSPLLIAISTDGGAPVFGQALRARIEALLPNQTVAWAQAAKAWRTDLEPLALSFAARRRFWERFSDLALAGTGLPPTEADRQACLDEAINQASVTRGPLDLVGLGPGDPDLVTLRAVRSLQSADVIVYSSGLDPSIIGLGRREAQVVAEHSADSSTARMIEKLVADGKKVVWAAQGDPTTCRRWLDRRIAFSIEPRQIVAGLRCGTCPAGCCEVSSKL